MSALTKPGYIFFSAIFLWCFYIWCQIEAMLNISKIFKIDEISRFSYSHSSVNVTAWPRDLDLEPEILKTICSLETYTLEILLL